MFRSKVSVVLRRKRRILFYLRKKKSGYSLLHSLYLRNLKKKNKKIKIKKEKVINMNEKETSKTKEKKEQESQKKTRHKDKGKEKTSDKESDEDTTEKILIPNGEHNKKSHHDRTKEKEKETDDTIARPRATTLSREQILLFEKEISKDYFLESILKDTNARNVFMDFCQQRQCVESLMFWLDVESFRLMGEDEVQMKKRANEIYAKYLVPASPYELNLSYKMRQEAKKNMTDPSITSFNNVQKEIFVLMVHGVFDHFLRSDAYQKWKGNNYNNKKKILKKKT